MDHRIRRTIALLERENFRCTQVKELAQKVGLGPSRLAHLFKAATGTSIRQFLMTRRLDLARRLLVTTDFRVSEILFLAGFTDPSNFDHAFRRRFGLSPREYRTCHYES